eukprot:Rmarinus@m.24453
MKLVTEMMKTYLSFTPSVYLSNPCWDVHEKIFEESEIQTCKYRYYDKENHCLDFEGLCEDIQAANGEAVFVFQCCGHNPTGVDPTEEQWQDLSNIFKDKGSLVIFDLAYQGIVSGDPDTDAFPIRLFGKKEIPTIVVQSFSANFGIYGERVGATHFLCADESEATRVKERLRLMNEVLYLSPPLHGARIVSRTFLSSKKTGEWHKFCKTAAERIRIVRDT